MLLYFIRHGDPIYAPDSLTPLGQRQAEAVARRLALHGLDEIYVSSSNRAKETARPTAELLHLTPVILDWAHEDYAWRQLTVIDAEEKRHWLFEYRPTKELMASREVQKMGFAWCEHPAFAGKGYDQGLERIRQEAEKFLGGLGYAHRVGENGYIAEAPGEKRVALFAHQGFGLAFLSCVMDIPYPEFVSRFDMSHTGVSVIEFRGEKGQTVIPRMLMLSNDSHLYREGLPTRYQNRVYV